MDIITIHEAYPGHYTQFLYAKQFPSKTRKALSTHSNAEGWAHYAEQMMIEEGFGGGDPKVRLAQLSEALLRDCRYIAGIGCTRRMRPWSRPRACSSKEDFRSLRTPMKRPAAALTIRHISTTRQGSLQIYKLREDYKRAQGANYSLEKFHEEFIRQGSIPIKLIRRILLKGDQAPAL